MLRKLFGRIFHVHDWETVAWKQIPVKDWRWSRSTEKTGILKIRKCLSCPKQECFLLNPTDGEKIFYDMDLAKKELGI